MRVLEFTPRIRLKGRVRGSGRFRTAGASAYPPGLCWRVGDLAVEAAHRLVSEGSLGLRPLRVPLPAQAWEEPVQTGSLVRWRTGDFWPADAVYIGRGSVRHSLAPIDMGLPFPTRSGGRPGGGAGSVPQMS